MTRAWRLVACLIGLGVLAYLIASVLLRRDLPAGSRLPHVDEVAPLGVRRGFAGELIVRGSALSGNPTLVAPFRFAVEDPSPGGSDASTFKARITVDPATPLGLYPVRILTDEGLSDPFPLAIGQLPQIREKEDNNDINGRAPEATWTAQRIVLPTVIEGELPDEDHDYFRFPVEKGQRIVAELLSARIGSGIDADLWIGSLDREYQAGLDLTPGDPADTPLFVRPPDAADYLFGVSRARPRPVKGGRNVYRLTIGAMPAAAEVYPMGGRRGETIRVELRGGTLDGVTAVTVPLTPLPGESVMRLRVPTTLRGPDGTLLDVEALPPLVVGDLPELLEATGPDRTPPKATPPVVFNGRLDPPGDEDHFKLDVTPGQRLRLDLASRALNSALYPRLKVLDARGNELATGSRRDVPARGSVPEHLTFDPSVEFRVPEGQTEVTVVVSGDRSDSPPTENLRTSDRGGSGHAYRVTVVPVDAAFSIALDAAQVSVPRGGTVAVGVTIARDGFDGPISLRVADPPAGLTFRPGTVAAGQTIGVFTVSASPEAAFGPLVLDVVGEGRGPSGPIQVRASKVITFGDPTTKAFKVTVDRGVDDKPVYSYFPAYLRTRPMTQVGLFATTVGADPLVLDAPAGPIEVTQGLRTSFKVTVTRPGGATGALILSPLPLPPGLRIPDVRLGASSTEATVEVMATGEQPTGEVTVVLTARGMVGGIDRNLVVPAVRLHVIRPAPRE